jgi:hypothetical protein
VKFSVYVQAVHIVVLHIKLHTGVAVATHVSVVMLDYAGPLVVVTLMVVFVNGIVYSKTQEKLIRLDIATCKRQAAPAVLLVIVTVGTFVGTLAMMTCA